MEENFNDVTDIDLELEQELGLTETEEPTIEEGSNETTTENNTTTVENSANSAENNVEPAKEPETKPTNDEKKEYAFAQLRKENSQLKQKEAEYQKEADFLKEMAASYGYTDVNKFKEDYRVAKLAKEAQEKGVDPVLYRQNADNERRIAQLENQLKQNDLQRKTDAIKASLDNAVSEYNLGENGITEIFNRLEKDGITVDYLLASPNPDNLIKSVLIDKIIEASKQSVIAKKETLENIADENISQGQEESTFNLDEFIDKELKDLDF